MMTGRGDNNSAVGGLTRHIPVLLAEVLEALAPNEGDVIVDGTFGAGGYTRAILDSGASVVGIDRDPDAIAAGKVLGTQSQGRLRLVPAPLPALYSGSKSIGVVRTLPVIGTPLKPAVATRVRLFMSMMLTLPAGSKPV